LDSVAAVTSKKMLPPFPDNEPLEPKIIQTIKPIRESDF
jgi:hypothetical protein